MATRQQIKAIVEAALVSAGAWPRGTAVNGNAVDGIHTHNDILIDALYSVIEYLSYNDFHDPTGGLPSSPSVGDTYIASATGNGWTNNYIYSWNGSSWDEQIPQRGWLVWVDGQDDFYSYTSTGWRSLSSSIGPHDHYRLVAQGTSTVSWYVDTDGGLVDAVNGWKIKNTSTKWQLYKWSGSAWVTIGKSTTYLP